MLDIKSQLEAALKAHLDSLPEGGDIPPPAVDPTNATGVNDPDKPELHIATPNGPQKASGPLAAQQFQGLHPEAKAKVADTGNAPRGYRSPVATNAALASTIKGVNAPKVSQGEDDGELLFPPGPEKVMQMPEMDLTSPPPKAGPAPVPPPGQAARAAVGGPLASSDMQAAQDASRRGRMIAGIGEVADSMAHQPMNLADYAISRGGGHPIETGPDTHAWDRIRADSDRPLAQLAQKLQMQRQATEDALTHRVKEADIGEKNATAYKAMHPEPKPPHEPLFDPAAKKAAMKADPVFRKEIAKTHKDVDAYIDSLPDDKTSLEDLDRNVSGQGKALTSINVTNQNDIAKIPIKGAAEVATGTAKDVVKERGNIAIAKRLVPELRAAWHAVTPLELGIYKSTGIKSGALAKFDGLALGTIDKTAAVESGGAARQGGINQWKETIKGGNYSDVSMDGVLDGLDKAIDISNDENEGKLKGLPDVGGQAGQKVTHMPPQVAIRSKKTGKEKLVPADQAQRFLADPNFERVGQ